MSTGKVVGNQDQYHVEGLIAKGAFSVVYRCTDLRDGKPYAIKVVNKKLAESQRMTEALIREVNAMEVASQSPYVVHLVDKLVSNNNYYIIMELAEGGTLLDMVRSHRRLNQYTWTAPFFKQLLAGLAAMHDNNVIHRDIKPENILFNKPKTRLMISDFGFACYAPAGCVLHRACGTLRYCAPELLVESPCYDGRKVDVWAAGVTLYVMFCCTHPFPTRASIDPDSLLETIKTTPLTFPSHIPDEAQDLMRKMLSVDPAKRWSARALLDHPWLAGIHPRLPGASDSDSELFGASRSQPEVRSGDASTTASVGAGASVTASKSAFSEVEMASLPTIGSLENIDDGFYHNSDGPEDEDDSDEATDNEDDCTSNSSVDSEGNFVDMGPSSSLRPTGAHFGQSSTFSSRRSSSVDDPGYTGSSTHSPHGGGPAPGSGDAVDMDVVFDSLFARPRAYIRGFLLTVRTFVGFIFFCFALSAATLLRVVFDTDISELPLPRRLRERLAANLVPTTATATDRKARRARTGRSALSNGPSTARADPHREGLLSHLPPQGLMADGPEVPGSRLRHYVRQAKRLISDSSLTLLPTQRQRQRDPRVRSELSAPPSPRRSLSFLASFVTGNGHGGAANLPHSPCLARCSSSPAFAQGLRQRTANPKADPTRLTVDTQPAGLPGLLSVVPAAETTADGKPLLSPASPLRDLSDTMVPVGSLNASVNTPATNAAVTAVAPPPPRGQHGLMPVLISPDASGSATWQPTRLPATAESPTPRGANGRRRSDQLLPPLPLLARESLLAAHEQTSTPDGEDVGALLAFSPSVPFRDWGKTRNSTEDFPMHDTGADVIKATNKTA